MYSSLVVWNLSNGLAGNTRFHLFILISYYFDFAINTYVQFFPCSLATLNPICNQVTIQHVFYQTNNSM